MATTSEPIKIDISELTSEDPAEIQREAFTGQPAKNRSPEAMACVKELRREVYDRHLAKVDHINPDIDRMRAAVASYLPLRWLFLVIIKGHPTVYCMRNCCLICNTPVSERVLAV